MLTISLILIPLITSLLLFLTKDKSVFKTISLASSLITFALAIVALIGFDKSIGRNFVFDTPWIHALGINFAFGMNGISLLLVLLTTLLVPIIIFSTFQQKNNYPASFFALILLMESALLGVFTSSDGFLFYIFWELALIPIYFICGLWGGENRIRITLKFFIYTMLGSLFMLAGFIWLYLKTPYPHSFAFDAILHVSLNGNEQLGVLTAFFLAFAIKIPVFPFHSWQPDTYTTAPFAGSMLLAGIMLKMGLYGVLQFILPVCSGILFYYGPIIIFLASVSVIYGSIIAIQQKEIKRLIAYSSLSHVGLMALAIFTLTADGIQGAIFQMLSHGINVVAMFFIAAIIYNRTQTTSIKDLGGIAKSAPRFAIFFMITMLGTVALPLTNGFIGEFMMLTGIAQYNIFIAAIVGLSIIFGAVYMFKLYQKSMYGDTNQLTESFADLTMNEMIIAVPLVILILGMGIYPKPFLEIAKPAVYTLLQISGM